MRIGIIGDLHYHIGNDSSEEFVRTHQSFFQSFLERLFRADAHHYVSIGDLTHFGSKREFDEIYNIVKSYDKSFNAILGNHDALLLKKDALTEYVKKPRYFSVEYDELYAVYLDTTKEKSPMDWGGELDNEQLQWFKEEIKKSGSKPMAVFAHHPVPATTTFSDQNMLAIDPLQNIMEILSEKQGVGFFFNGHNHSYSIFQKEQWSFIQLGAVFDKPSYQIFEINHEVATVNTYFIEDKDIIESASYLGKQLTGFSALSADEAHWEEQDLRLTLDLKEEVTKLVRSV